MLGQKNKSGFILIIVAVIVAIGGFMGYRALQDESDVNARTIETADKMDIDTPVVAESTEAEKVSADTTEQAEQNKTLSSDGEINVEPGNPVVARVDGKEITRVDVYRFIQTMPANMQQLPATQIYPIAMDQVINTRIVQNEADNADIQNSEEFKREVDIAKQQIVRNLYLQNAVDKKISDKMVKKAYDDYVKKIPDVEERRARHILVETEEKAKAVLAKLKTGEKFEALAQSLSIGPTGPKGGDLGYFAKNEMVPEFAEAAFKMKKGDVSEAPVQTQFGWHVIKVEDTRQRPKPTMEQMRPVLQAELRRTALDDLLKDLRKDVKIEQFDINGKPLREGADATGLVLDNNKKSN